MGPLGMPEIIFLFVLALLILGPKKLPELGRSIGKGMSEFRRASNELRNTFDREMQSVEQENQALKKEVDEVNQAANPVTTYDDPYSDYGYSSEPTASPAATSNEAPPNESTSSVSAGQAAESQPVPQTEGSETPK